MARRNIAMVTSFPFPRVCCDGGSLALFEIAEWLHEHGLLAGTYVFVDRRGFGGRTRSRYWDEIRTEKGIDLDIIQYEDDALKHVVRKLQEDNIDYTFTCDNDFLALLAVSILAIPGAHMFNACNNVQSFEKCSLWTSLLRKRELYASSGFLHERVTALLNVDTSIWHPLQNLTKYMASKANNDPRVVGYYSSGPHKGDEIVKEIIVRMPDMRFIVMGGRCGNALREGPKNLTYVGEVEDVRSFYREIGLLLVPSLLDEAYGRVILEAAINGIPAIANRVGGIPEALGNSGLLVDINLKNYSLDVVAQQYVTLIRMLVSQPSEYDLLCEKARRRAAQYMRDISQVQESFLAGLKAGRRQSAQVGVLT